VCVCVCVCVCMHATLPVRLRRPVPPHFHTWADVWAANYHDMCVCRRIGGQPSVASKRR
jgi:hypothetical protein